MALGSAVKMCPTSGLRALPCGVQAEAAVPPLPSIPPEPPTLAPPAPGVAPPLLVPPALVSPPLAPPPVPAPPVFTDAPPVAPGVPPLPESGVLPPSPEQAQVTANKPLTYKSIAQPARARESGRGEFNVGRG